MWKSTGPLLALLLLSFAGCSSGGTRPQLPPATEAPVTVATSHPVAAGAGRAGATAAPTTAAPHAAPPHPAPSTPAATSVRHESLLLVTRDQSINLRDLSSGGDKERVLISTPAGTVPGFPAWSPGGARFLYVLDKLFAGDTKTDWGADLYEANADGSGQRLLLRHDAPGAEIDSPTWTPDGRAILFGYASLTFDAQGNFQSERYEVRRLDPATGAVVTVLENATSPGLCADGSLLASVRFDPDSNSRIAVDVSNADGSGRRTVLTATPDAQAFLYPRFSPECRRIVVAAIDATGARLLPEPPRPLLAYRGARLPNRRFPNRPYMGAASAAHGSPWELWTVDADGSDRRRLTHLAEDEPYAVWPADGRTLLFVGTGGLYTLDADGSHLKKFGDGATHGQVALLER